MKSSFGFGQGNRDTVQSGHVIQGRLWCQVRHWYQERTYIWRTSCNTRLATIYGNCPCGMILCSIHVPPTTRKTSGFVLTAVALETLVEPLFLTWRQCSWCMTSGVTQATTSWSKSTRPVGGKDLLKASLLSFANSKFCHLRCV